MCSISFDCIARIFTCLFGVFHTQQRQDRDDYITVNWDNIESDWKPWYQKKQNSEIDETISRIPYDELSLMHYKGFAGFAHAIESKKPVVTSKVGILKFSSEICLDYTKLHIDTFHNIYCLIWISNYMIFN